MLLCTTTSVLFAQAKNDKLVSFSSKIDFVNFQFSKKDNYLVDYKKYLSFPIQFSIYNPKPGFNPTKMEYQKYYSFKNTNLLLKREMSNKEPEPIFPDQEKKKSLGESIFNDVLDGIFNKKSK